MHIQFHCCHVAGALGGQDSSVGLVVALQLVEATGSSRTEVDHTRGHLVLLGTNYRVERSIGEFDSHVTDGRILPYLVDGDLDGGAFLAAGKDGNGELIVAHCTVLLNQRCMHAVCHRWSLRRRGGG